MRRGRELDRMVARVGTRETRFVPSRILRPTDEITIHGR